MFLTRLKHILIELRGHAPFTALGAVLGITFMLLFHAFTSTGSHTLFSIFHPAHVALSALVTASMFRLHKGKSRFLLVVLVGYFGSIGIATLSDIIIPHIGDEILGLHIPAHSEIHGHTEETAAEHTEAVAANSDHQHGPPLHLGFIEEWYLVNPAALLGIFIAYFAPHTKFPHAGHILISTWASSSYMLMNLVSEITLLTAVGMFGVLFLAVWLPCCISDIIFPLLLVKSDLQITGPCPDHARHSHSHVHAHKSSE
jgi:hypothetical protein